MSEPRSIGGVLTMYGGQRRRRAIRRLREDQEAVLVKEALDEAAPPSSPVVGYWMIPDGDGGYVKLKINESYQLGRDRHPVIMGGIPYPGWALIANKNLLSRYAKRIVKQVESTYDHLTTDIGSPDWADYMGNVEDTAKAQGWAFFIEQHGTGWLGYSRASGMLSAFGNEFFGGKAQPPTSVVTSATAHTFKVDQGRGWKTIDEEAFKKLVKSHGPKKEERKFYKDFRELLSDWENKKLDWNTTNHERVRELFKPPVINQAFRSLDPIRVAKFTALWLGATKRANVNLPYSLSSYSPEVQDAINTVNGKKPKVASKTGADRFAPPTPKNESGPSKLLMEGVVAEMLTEGLLFERMSYAKLLANTRNHGRYKVGGMVRVNGKWTTDVAIPGRADNARFVMGSPPLTHIERDGSVVYRWKFKSRADRSTTGKVHLSYLRVMPKKKGIMGFLKNLIQGKGPWEGDCEVWCNCEDFRFRAHYANWKAGASHKPTGQNGDSTNAAPVKTNPKMIPLLCKHLVCGSIYLQDPPKKLVKSVEELRVLADERAEKVGGYEPPDPKESPEMEPGQEPEPPSGEPTEDEEDETGLAGASDQIEGPTPTA